MKPWWRLMLAGMISGTAGLASAAPLPVDSPAAKQEAERLDSLSPVAPSHGVHIDHSGRTQKGGASYYAKHFANHKMADGRRMNPNSNIAASKTLPLGSVAKVTNLQNGKTATVKIEDRGPYVDGRVVDLAPKVAEQLDIKQHGVVPVEVKPITLPQPNGEVRLGSGAAETSPSELKAAVEMTKGLTAPPNTETATSR